MRKIEDILEGDQMPCFDNLRKEINELQCALAFERDSLSYETKRCKDALAEKDAEIEELQNNMLLLAQECLDSTEDLLQADLARVETSIDKIVSDM